MRKLSKCYNPFATSSFKGFLSNKSFKQSRLKKIFFSGLFYFIGNVGFGQDIAGWNFFGRSQDETLAATAFDPNLASPINLTRGMGAGSSSALNSFRTTGFKNDGISVANTDYFQTTLTAKTGYEISLSTIDAVFAGTASYYASTGVTSQFAYSLDGNAFTLIGNPVTTTSLTLPQIDLRGIAALQNVPSDVTVTIRYYASGQTTTGGWGFTSSTASKNGFVIGGTVTSAGSEDFTSGYYRSRQNGDWAAATTWESSADNVTWSIAGKAPTKDAEKIMIQNGHTVGVSTSVSLDQTTISGILELQTGGILNINDGAGDDIIISENGILRIVSTGNYATVLQQSVGANINITSGGKIIIGNGIASTGNGYEGFATSIVNTWNDGAVYEWNSNSTFAIADLTYFPNAGTSIPKFRVTKVGGTINSSKDFFLNGILEVNTDMAFSGGGKKYFRNGIRGNAALSQITPGMGKFYLTAPGAVLDGASLRIDLLQPIDMSPSTFVPFGANVTVSGANINNNIASNVFTVNGTLDVTNNGVSNLNGSIIINGIYRTSFSGGFSGSGSSIVSGNITLNPGSTIELYAPGNQSLNTRIDFRNLVFSGSGIKTPNGPFNPNGTITIKDDAIFDCTGNINGINIGDDNTNLTMTGNSRLIVSTFGPNPKMGGIYNLSGGVIEFRGSGGTAQTIRNQTYQNIEVTGNNVNNSDGNIILNNSGTFTVKSGGVFSINDNTIAGPAGTQTIIVESGGIFKCGNTRGFHGFAFTTVPKFNSSVNADIENIILQPNSTVEYSRSQPPLSSGDQPITTANGLIYQNLILSGTGNKTAPPDDLIIQGNLSKTGSCTFVHNDGTVIFNGSSAQSYNATFPQLLFNNLTNENLIALNVNSSLSIYKKLLLKDNSKINLNADITLNSDKNRTANVAKIPVNATINYNAGRFVVERYINSGNTPGSHSKSWQLLSAPAFGETIFNSWQEHGDNAIAGFGTWITDPSGTANGFDAISISPSVKKFNSLTQSWEGIESTTISVSDPNGYFVYVRGDRTVRDVATSANPATLRTRGKLFRDDQPPVIVAANSYQSIANPYASVIDFSKLITSNIDNSFYVWDPSIQGSYNAGGYQTIAASTGFIAVPGGSAIFTSNTDYRNIQSGQAFMVHNSLLMNGAVSFTEDCKMADGHHLVHREGAERQMFFASLYNKDGFLADGNAVVFDEDFSNDTDGDDAAKMLNSGENFGIKRNNKNFAIEARQPVSRPDTIFYDLRNLKKQEYHLVFAPKNIGQGISASLNDRFLKTETTVSLNDSTSFDFSITSDPASYAADRFFVGFVPLSAERILSLSFISVKAYQKNKNILVEWKVENENNIDHYEIDHSVDGVQFLLREDKNTLGLKENSNSYLDEKPVSGNNFYRVRGIDKNGNTVISPVVKLFMETLKTSISILSNPVEGDVIKLLFTNYHTGKYQMNIYNTSGELLQRKTMLLAGENEYQTVRINKSWSAGIYHLEIIKPDGTKVFLSVIK